jgi:hypothetical protein
VSAERRPNSKTVRRAVWDAMHERWCGPGCDPNCTEWAPDLAAIDAAIAAVRKYDADRRSWSSF